MITYALLKIIELILYATTAAIQNLPDVSLPTAFTSAISTALSYITAFNHFIPLPTILEIFVLVLAIEGRVFIYKATMWLLKRFPTQS